MGGPFVFPEFGCRYGFPAFEMVLYLPPAWKFFLRPAAFSKCFSFGGGGAGAAAAGARFFLPCFFLGATATRSWVRSSSCLYQLQRRTFIKDTPSLRSNFGVWFSRWLLFVFFWGRGGDIFVGERNKREKLTKTSATRSTLFKGIFDQAQHGKFSLETSPRTASLRFCGPISGCAKPIPSNLWDSALQMAAMIEAT